MSEIVSKINAEAQFQFNRGTATEWAENDIVLAEGEPALLLDENKKTIGIKYGDGKKKFSELELTGANVDLNYDPESENAQSGKAVAEAIAGIELPEGGGSGGIVDQIFDPESKNAQSGKAVAQAIANGENNLITSLAELNSAISGGISPISFSPEADIEISSTLYFPANTVILGNGATIKRANGFNGKLISLKDDCKLSNLKIDGNRENVASPTWDNTIEISTLARCVIENVVIEHGNEAIICYGDDVVVRHCQIINCGGNGIHFSGGNRTRVENCTIIGANKKLGMGHEGGCISWSMACNYVICQNNYLEDALSGLGYIQWHEASHLKIVGNTVKNCQKAIFSEWTGLKDEVVPSNILIANNHFISCGGYASGILISNANPNENRKAKNITISNNILEDTSIKIRGAKDLVVSDNVIVGGHIFIQYSPETIISNNNINANYVAGIEFQWSRRVKIINNIVRAMPYCVYLSDCPFSIISGNHCAQHLGTPSGNNIYKQGSNGTTIENNQLFIYLGNGINASNGDIVSNNRIDCANTDIIAIRIWGGVTGAIAEKNLTNGTFAISNPTNGFAGNNYQLPETEFLSVTFTLTNITTNGIAKVLNGDNYTCTLTASSGYSLPNTITVTMGETITTNYTYNKSTGEVVIPNVTGAVTITAGGI